MSNSGHNIFSVPNFRQGENHEDTKTVVIVILFLLLNSVAYAQEGPASVQETAGARPDQAGQAKEANRLPFEKEGWQFFVAPYMWLVG